MVILRTLATGPWPLNPELRKHAGTTASAHNEQCRQRCTGPSLELHCFGTQESSLLLLGFFTGLSGLGLTLLPDAASQLATVSLLRAELFPVRTSSGSKSKAC